MMRQFLNIVHQAIQLPLPIHLGPSTQRKAMQPFVAPDIAKHGLDRRETTGDHGSTHVGVDFGFHFIGFTGATALALKEGDLACFCFLGCSQTFVTALARYAVLLRAGEFQRFVAAEGAVGAVTVQTFAGGTQTVRLIVG